MLTADDRKLLAALPRDAYGMREQQPIEQQARDIILIRTSRLARDGIRITLPPIAGWSR